ncbi:putative membrane protein [Selenomonas ruminantium subsp. lactilytica TAM6421]|uniref:Putative membrane protein n=1 Tax=Selenomonas ruminantium subsp. lactilytica (strain NBRC 103574 / TAM6421) TaxID=927704 RepID=I0GRP9_SELRL|nr:polysaccharide biosynthesis C-terminal domain-containing protein [Selenomonas ruminantium]BAL83436.1 putative membrane protein [Selenomonas ruminantium subsp. lactilytica TAM6421]
MSRTTNAWRNIFFGMINRIVKIIVPFLLRSLIIYKIGIEYLGLDGLFVSILQVLNVAELGFSSAVVFSLYRPLAEKNTTIICALLSFYRKIYRFMGAVIFGLGLLFMPFLDRIISGTIPSDMNIYVLYILYLFNTVLGYFLYAYKNSIIIADQRADIISNIDSIMLLFRCTVQIILVFVFNNYYAYVLVFPLFTILNNFLVKCITDKYYPIYVCKGDIDSALYKDIRKRVVGLMIYKLCGVSRNSFDNMFLSAYLGLYTVAVYNNYYLILTGVISVMGVVSQAVVASIGNSIATESASKNYNDFKLFNFIYMFIAGGMTIILLVTYQPFMMLWLGEDYMLPFYVVIAMSAYFYVLKMGDVRGMYNDAAGLWWEQRYRTVLEVIVNVVLNYIFIKYCGVLGVVLASLISCFLVGFLGSSFVTFKYYFGRNNLCEYLNSQIIYFFTTICIACLVLYVISVSGQLILPFEIMKRVIISLIIYFIMMWMIWHNTKNFKSAKNFFRSSISMFNKVK